MRPPMRFMKNSSRFEPVIDKNFTRSSSGVRLSAASLSTRLLKRSQVSSRFRYSFGDERSGPAAAAEACAFTAFSLAGAGAFSAAFSMALSPLRLCFFFRLPYVLPRRARLNVLVQHPASSPSYEPCFFPSTTEALLPLIRNMACGIRFSSLVTVTMKRLSSMA